MMRMSRVSRVRVVSGGNEGDERSAIFFPCVCFCAHSNALYHALYPSSSSSINDD